MSSHALPATGDPAVYIIHDNPEWIARSPRRSTASASHTSNGCCRTLIDLSAEPPAGVFWSRLSASAHTRTIRM